jgi:hypothetical protein
LEETAQRTFTDCQPSVDSEEYIPSACQHAKEPPANLIPTVVKQAGVFSLTPVADVQSRNIPRTRTLPPHAARVGRDVGVPEQSTSDTDARLFKKAVSRGRSFGHGVRCRGGLTWRWNVFPDYFTPQAGFRHENLPRAAFNPRSLVPQAGANYARSTCRALLFGDSLSPLPAWPWAFIRSFTPAIA